MNGRFVTPAAHGDAKSQQQTRECVNLRRGGGRLGISDVLLAVRVLYATLLTQASLVAAVGCCKF